jgi:hypothetical protein
MGFSAIVVLCALASRERVELCAGWACFHSRSKRQLVVLMGGVSHVTLPQTREWLGVIAWPSCGDIRRALVRRPSSSVRIVLSLWCDA